LDVATLQKAHNERATVEELIGSLAVYHGELLPGFYDEWVALERARMQSIFEQKMARLLAALIDERRWTDVLDWAERWIACGETSELAYRALMMAHHARGDLSKVAAAWQRCVQAMRKQLGMEPSAKTLALYEQMRKGASRLAFSSASAKESLSPLGLVDRRSPGYDRRKSPRLI
jgi:DNA-binding SARP family transcriptional activator